ncbi:hypothetical protein QUF50_03240 [Thiotrichales bacterium HSG1]|nr:hypothetical protein [Thiotrichales bacterium HSG1]
MKIERCCKVMMVVMVIAILTAVVIPAYYCKILPLNNDVKILLSEVMLSFAQIKTELGVYRVDMGEYPQTFEASGFTSSVYVKEVVYSRTTTTGPTLCFNLVDDLGKIGFTNVKGDWSCKQSDVQSVEPNCTPYIEYLPKRCMK